MRPALLVVLVPAVLAVTTGSTGCAAHLSSPGSAAEGDTRVLAVERTTGSYTSSVALPARTRTLRLHLDCVGSGELTVRLDFAHVAVPCRDSSPSSPGEATLIGSKEPLERHQDVTVTSAADSTWSVTIDASPDALP